MNEHNFRVQIRPAILADSAGIAHVQISSYLTAYKLFIPLPYYDEMTEAEQTQDWTDLMNDPQHEPLYVAANDRQVVGYALGKTQPPGFDENMGELDAVHVLKDYQRHGIGSRLFTTVAHEMKQRGKTGMVLWTLEGNPVRAFYERLGGTLAGTKEYDVDDIHVTEVAYRWNDIDTLIARLTKRNGA